MSVRTPYLAFFGSFAFALCTSAWADTTTSAPQAANAVVTGPASSMLNFPLLRSGDLSYPVYINYATADGTALAASDYTSSSGQLTIPAGTTYLTLPVTVLGATGNYYPDKTFTLNLTNIVGVGPIPQFASPHTFGTGSLPEDVTVADLNSDGRPDLIVANHNDGTVGIFLNTTAPGAATPTFSSEQTFPSDGGFPTAVATADINGDGLPDIIVVNANSNDVAVLLNTTAPGATSASFAAAQTFATGPTPLSVVAADINGDGRPDLVVANGFNNTVSVLLDTTTPGSSTASFVSQQVFPVGYYPQSVAVADLNGDGLPDIIATTYNSPNNAVAVLINTSSTGSFALSFAAPVSFVTGNFPQDVAVADLNGDGRPDLVVTDSLDDTVSVLLNTTAAGAATPSFTSQQTFLTGNFPWGVKVVDVNGDGRPDLVVADAESNAVSVLLNTTAPGATAASFEAAQTYPGGTNPLSVAIADVNGDGLPDLIVVDGSGEALSVSLNTTPTGATAVNFSSGHTFYTGGGFPLSVAAADVNGDGKPDLIIANEASNNVAVLLNITPPGASAPTFAPAQTFGTQANPFAVVVADINGDGRPDLIVANGGSPTVSVLLNTTVPGASTPSFATQQLFNVGTVQTAIAVTDINGDGMPDIIANNTEGFNTVAVLLNTTPPGASTLSFAAAQTFGTGTTPYAVTTADINGDGKPDIIVANQASANISVLLNITVPGSLTAAFLAHQDFPAGGLPASVAIADLNGDGKPDIAVANAGSHQISILLNTTATGSYTVSFAGDQTVSTGAAPLSIAAADVDGDGRPDLVAADDIDNNAELFLNLTTPGATTATFSTPQLFPSAGETLAVTLADVNGDGKPDIIALDAGLSDAVVFLNTQYAAAVIPTSVTGTIYYSVPVAPVAFDNGVATGIGQVLDGQLEVAAGDDAPLDYAEVSGPSHGNLTLSAATGKFVYTPDAGFNGSDSFTFDASQGSLTSNVATETISVRDPAASALDGNVTTEGRHNVQGVLAATLAYSGQVLTFKILTGPTRGRVRLTDAGTGAFLYSPSGSESGTFSFTFDVIDTYGIISNTATETVTVDPRLHK